MQEFGVRPSSWLTFLAPNSNAHRNPLLPKPVRFKHLAKQEEIPLAPDLIAPDAWCITLFRGLRMAESQHILLRKR